MNSILTVILASVPMYKAVMRDWHIAKLSIFENHLFNSFLKESEIAKPKRAQIWIK